MSEWTTVLRQHLASLRLTPEREADIIEELSQHLDDRVRELTSAGQPPHTARSMALAELEEPGHLSGRLQRLRQASSPPQRTPGEPRRRLLGDLWRDLQYAGRVLRKQPGFTVAAVLTLALGIGANTAVFSVVRHVLLTPLPYAEPERVAVIWSKWRGFDKTWVSDAEADDYKRRTSAFADVGAWSVGQVNLNGDDDAVRIGSAQVTPNLFDVLGVRPLLGRTFDQTDASARPTTVILSHRLWSGRYAGDDSIIGRTILVNGTALEVIGVMPAQFQLPTDYVQDAEEPTAVWIPYLLETQNRGSHGLHAAGRLRDGVSMAQANAELQTLTQTLTSEGLYPKGMEFSAFVVSATDEAFAAVRPALWLVFGAVGCLLLIACANVANLLLVRAESRAREFAVRSALGADRIRLVRQLVSEGLWLAAIASVVGVGLAYGGLQALRSSGLSGIPRSADIAVDAQVLLFSLSITIVTLFLFSLAPALRAARVDLTDSLKDGAQHATAGGRRQRLRGALVVAETAMAVILLAGAVLLMRSLGQLQNIDLGFQPAGAITMRLALPATTYDTPEKVVNFYTRLLEQTRATAGVQHAGYLRLLPLAAPIGDWGLMVEGYRPPPGVGTPGDWQVASDGALAAMGERIVAGRDLTPADSIGGQDVALINETMAQKYWDGRNPVGGRFRMGNNVERPWITVVGVVGNVRHNGMTAEVKPKFYRPFGQFHQSTGNPARNLTLVARTAGDPGALAAPLRAHVRALDPQVPVAAIRTLEDVVNTSIATPRLTGSVLVLFASLALLLAGIGIYGVLSFVVNQRRQELGIRLAIGAARGNVLRLVLRGGLALTSVGIVVGLAVAALATPLLTPLLHNVTPYDPWTFVAVPLVLLTISAAAAIVPAWRASRVDPLTALRSQ
jgi:putative ABC transport system permease protein